MDKLAIEQELNQINKTNEVKNEISLQELIDDEVIDLIEVNKINEIPPLQELIDDEEIKKMNITKLAPNLEKIQQGIENLKKNLGGHFENCRDITYQFMLISEYFKQINDNFYFAKKEKSFDPILNKIQTNILKSFDLMINKQLNQNMFSAETLETETVISLYQEIIKKCKTDAKKGFLIYNFSNCCSQLREQVCALLKSSGYKVKESEDNEILIKWFK